MNTIRNSLLGLSLMMGVQMSVAAYAADEHDHPRPEDRAAPRPAAVRPAAPRGQVFDARYNHGRYYPSMGTVRPDLPVGYHPYFHGSDRFFFAGGVWYAPRGPGFVVVAPPVGLVIGVLPAYYSTVWFAGVPYYYADNVYYTQSPDQSGYVVADPPPNADQPAPPPDAPPPTSTPDMDLIIYPKNGQTNAIRGRRVRRALIPHNRPATVPAIRTWATITTTGPCRPACRRAGIKSTSGGFRRRGDRARIQSEARRMRIHIAMRLAQEAGQSQA